MRKSIQRGMFLTGGECPGEIVLSQREALRMSVARGDFIRTGPTSFAKAPRPGQPLDEAIRHATKAREMAEQLSKALRGSRH
jgi:hypothetical protein